jgi:hypothetical protein
MHGDEINQIKSHKETSKFRYRRKVKIHFQLLHVNMANQNASSTNEQ